MATATCWARLRRKTRSDCVNSFLFPLRQTEISPMRWWFFKTGVAIRCSYGLSCVPSIKIERGSWMALLTISPFFLLAISPRMPCPNLGETVLISSASSPFAAIPFLIQLWMFVSPVIYPVSIVNEKYRWVLAINPMGGLINAYRNSLLGHKPIDWELLGISAIVITALFFSGMYYFRRMEKTFSDVV